MPSTISLLKPCTVLGLDGILAVCSLVDVEIYSVLSGTVIDIVTTDADGLFPDTVVVDPVGSTMILRILLAPGGLCGCGAVTTIATP